MKKIIFMPFINDDNGKKWRRNLEAAFIGSDGGPLTDSINIIRSNKNNGTYQSVQDYYNDLHAAKRQRQTSWLSYLIAQTAELFGNKLKDLSGDDLDPEKTTVVCALPEFFWCDINDNNKHPEITNYHKPLYLENALTVLTELKTEGLEENALMALTAKYRNMIFFAGTAMWKQINPKDHNDEEIFNSLIVYAEGQFKESITKHNISTIDGFYINYRCGVSSLVKKKVGEATFNAVPITEFNDMKFTYDICLDFKCPKPGNVYIPLSTELCGENSVDVNVLIAAGMPVEQAYVENIKSDLLLRCDGSSSPQGQILYKHGKETDDNCLIPITVN